ncbi:MAG: hypothetical protein GTO53_11915 [Planctomycetales bacterium]|nr:hypothetical protein [Planctomycetales bacterium]NIM09816.1 hypothetical protein [Planctomycetales bacterium]NIN09285.1 hypothetical protein [Planctomycetales bacterium]NIN78388.1 hypothetical protein [Planctomycetales bacterium]NIO35566.1 hypothetical protein [Planctomycetales bacterium]
MEFEVQRCTRQCAATGQEFEAEQEFFSVLLVEEAQVVRKDYSTAAWQGPPPDALGWWKSRMPARHAHRLHWAPNDIMLEYFEELQDQPDKQDVRYVLALLMIRRRVLRLEEQEQTAEGGQKLTLYCPRREKSYELGVVEPDRQRQQEIQEELAALLFADAA